jgi:hypothetical protein
MNRILSIAWRLLASPVSAMSRSAWLACTAWTRSLVSRHGLMQGPLRSAQRSCGAATNSMKNGGALDDVRAGLAEESEELLVPRLHPQARGRSSWAAGTDVLGAAPLREEAVRPQRTIKGKESAHSSPLSTYTAPGGLRQDPGHAAEWLAGARTYGNGGREMRVLLSTYDSRGGVEPLVALAVRLQAIGAEVRVCAPPDCAERLAEVGVPLVPVGQPVRPLVHGATPPSAADVPRRTSDRRGRHDPHRRGDGRRDAAARRGQPGKAAGVRVNHTGSSSHQVRHAGPRRLAAPNGCQRPQIGADGREPAD